MVVLNIQQPNRSDRDRLGFHPNCAVCRQENVFGLLAPEALFSRRVQALLASGVLALSVGATGTSIAAEPDRQHEGISVPDQPSQGTGQEEDLGSAPETTLPFDVDPSPPSPRQDEVDEGEDVVPLEHEPADDPDARLPLTEPDQPPPAVGDDVPVPPVEAAPPPPPPAAAPDHSSEVEPKRPPTLQPDDPPPAAGAPGDQRRPRRTGRSRRAAGRDGSGSQRVREVAAPVQLPVNTSVLAAAEPVGGPAVATPIAHIPSGARFHVVRRGESLWSIATALLGPEAPAARVTREVGRLWEHNAQRIGTGDPDLLPVGVRLELR